ncbi:MAG: hypothetical protein K0B09_09705 [Bacteroidales bacterium]|nr:hypothetical protein [Bacteroidales bacterium]
MKKILLLLFAFVSLLFSSCLKDEVAEPYPEPEPGELELIHYWHFNTLAGVVEEVASDFSAVGSALITYPGTGPGYMDERTHREADPVSSWNLRMGEGPEQGAVLRVRNPADTRELIFDIPSTGYEGLVFMFASTRSDNGSTLQRFHYSANGGATWTAVGEDYVIPSIVGTGEYIHKTIDLSEIAAVNNNPDLKFKILFTSPEAGNPSGNNRFDNITLDGIKITK